jgi:hypothetical protein
MSLVSYFSAWLLTKGKRISEQGKKNENGEEKRRET